MTFTGDWHEPKWEEFVRQQYRNRLDESDPTHRKNSSSKPKNKSSNNKRNFKKNWKDESEYARFCRPQKLYNLEMFLLQFDKAEQELVKTESDNIELPWPDNKQLNYLFNDCDNLCSIKNRCKKILLRLHPDKIAQRLCCRIASDGLKKIVEQATKFAQMLNSYKV